MTTRSYEALVILRASGTEQDVARQATQLEDPIKRLGGSIESVQSLGRRRLAFRIARQAEGYYYLLRFQVPTAQFKELDRLLRLNEAIVRFMILTAEEAGPVANRISTFVARAAGSRDRDSFRSGPPAARTPAPARS
jgi:small subunit ribosomal protein S6